MNNKPSILLLLLSIYSNFIYGQNKGIQFDNESSWSQIKEKALRENKYIFIDCYATWCGPCKAMDKQVYPSDSVGEILNKNFISVKLQMDQTPIDNNYVKSWSKNANEFRHQYNISGYPSYLFFSPAGKIVHQGTGFMDAIAFISLITAALSIDKQFYTMLEKYNLGKMVTENEVRSFVNYARNTGNDSISNEIARKFKKKYLDSLNIFQLCNNENINFIRDNYSLVSSRDNYFSLFLNYPQKTDSIEPGLAEFIVKNVIRNEEINKKVWNGNTPISQNPDWEIIYSNIMNKYGKRYADAIVPPSQKDFFLRTNKWNEYAKIQNNEIKNKTIEPGGNYGLYSWDLNISAWRTYQSCDDTSILNMALSWVNLAINLVEDRIPNPAEQYYDTKARILYKIGRASEAMETEQKAIDVGQVMAKSRGLEKAGLFDEYSQVLKRMKLGKPINDL